MSNTDAVTRVVDQLVKRIFDQRHFTNGQINYFFTELVNKCDFEDNFDRTLKINENVCLIEDKYSQDMCKANDPIAQDVDQKVSKLLARTEAILAAETKHRDTYNQVVSKKRSELAKKVDECSKDCKIRLESLQESIVQEQLELERKYLRFEENLRNK